MMAVRISRAKRRMVYLRSKDVKTMRAVGANGAQKLCKGVDVHAVVASRIGASIYRGLLAIHYAGGVLTKDARVKHGRRPRR
jgi:hypothetical protein